MTKPGEAPTTDDVIRSVIPADVLRNLRNPLRWRDCNHPVNDYQAWRTCTVDPCCDPPEAS